MTMYFPVVAAWPCVGKSHFARSNNQVYDIDEHEHGSVRARYPDIEEFVSVFAPMVATRVREGMRPVLMASHNRLVEEVARLGLQTLLIVPKDECRLEYIQRIWKRRRHDASSLATGLSRHWDEWLWQALRPRQNVTVVRIGAGQYLSDILGVTQGRCHLL